MIKYCDDQFLDIWGKTTSEKSFLEVSVHLEPAQKKSFFAEVGRLGLSSEVMIDNVQQAIELANQVSANATDVIMISRMSLKLIFSPKTMTLSLTIIAVSRTFVPRWFIR